MLKSSQGLFQKKILLLFLKQDWVKAEAGSLEGGHCKPLPPPPHQQAQGRATNYEIIMKLKKKINHEAVKNHTMWRIQCFINPNLGGLFRGPFWGVCVCVCVGVCVCVCVCVCVYVRGGKITPCPKLVRIARNLKFGT